jgi:phenylpropionate dioxygenase-like ring-hydroxylating dioxygenase large terminal subunit
MKLVSAWYPVMKSSELGEKPVPFNFLEQDLVLYRTAEGSPQALQRVCPHRGYDLAEGRVSGPYLVCPYHGWSFAADGSGHSPGTPRLVCTIKSVAAAEHLGMIWLCESSDHPFEESDAFRLVQVEGSRYCGEFVADFEGPIEVVIDNFNEIEHTGEVHGMFGYPTSRMNEVEISWERLETGKFSITSLGPQKPIGLPVRLALGLANTDYFSGKWITTVKPWTSAYIDRWYTSKAADSERKFGLDLRIFFLPLPKNRTRLVTFVYTSNLPFFPIARHILLEMIRKEVGYDQNVVAHLLNPEQTLSGRRLSRFDAVLQELRRDQLVAR